jgi:hypothetical protein
MEFACGSMEDIEEMDWKVGAFGIGDLFARLEAERGTMMALVMALVMELVRLQ